MSATGLTEVAGTSVCEACRWAAVATLGVADCLATETGAAAGAAASLLPEPGQANALQANKDKGIRKYFIDDSSMPVEERRI
jgi:hypothetical protein